MEFWSTQFNHCIIAKNLSRIYKTLAFKTIVLKTTYRKTGPRSRTVQFVCIHIQSIQNLQHGNTLHTYKDIFWIKEVNFIIRQNKTKISVRNVYFIIIITQNKISNVYMIRGIQIKNINTRLKKLILQPACCPLGSTIYPVINLWKIHPLHHSHPHIQNQFGITNTRTQNCSRKILKNLRLFLFIFNSWLYNK